jgi:hypothetical protein
MRTDAGSRPRGIAAGFLGRLADGPHAALHGLVGEERVQHHHVGGAAGKGERVRAEGDEPDRDVLVER